MARSSAAKNLPVSPAPAPPKARGKKAPAAPPSHLAAQGEVTIQQIDRKDYAPNVVAIAMTVRGISTLIVNNFNQKIREQLLAKHMGKAVKGREVKDPAALFEGSKYKDEEGRDCVPAGALRNAIIDAARTLDDKKLSMTVLKQAIFVEGPDGPQQTLLPIAFGRCVMREDPVRNDNGNPDIRIRAEYHDWSLSFTLHIIEKKVPIVQAYQLVELAGFSVGICEWRPQGKEGKGGPHGRFTIQGG